MPRPIKISQNNLIECGVNMMTPSPANFQNGTPPVPVPECVADYLNLSSDEMLAQSFAYAEMPIVAVLRAR